MATSPGDEQTVQFMLKRWKDPDSGLDDAWRQEYAVYLSFPDPEKPNKVTVGVWDWNEDVQHVAIVTDGSVTISCLFLVDPSDAELYTVREKEKPYYDDQRHPDVVQPYAAYAPAGHPRVKHCSSQQTQNLPQLVSIY